MFDFFGHLCDAVIYHNFFLGHPVCCSFIKVPFFLILMNKECIELSKMVLEEPVAIKMNSVEQLIFLLTISSIFKYLLRFLSCGFKMGKKGPSRAWILVKIWISPPFIL